MDNNSSNSSNLNFNEQTTKDSEGNIIKTYFINNKPVDEKVFLTLSDDFYSNIPKKKTNKVINISKKEICDEDFSDEQPLINQSNYSDEEYETLFAIVANIKGMEEEDAIDFLGDIFLRNNELTVLDTQSQIYDELGKGMLKLSSQIEVELENAVNEFSGNDGLENN